MVAAYGAKTPIIRGDTLYVLGTHDFDDVVSDLLLPFLPDTTILPQYHSASTLMSPAIKRVVGHSLGAAVARDIGRKYHVLDVGYGSPVTNSINYTDPLDVVHRYASFAVEGFGHLHGGHTYNLLKNKQPLLHHSVQDYTLP